MSRGSRARVPLPLARKLGARARATARRRPLPVIVALAGGVGGARLAVGLAAALPPSDLSIVVNTGDDFEHFGLTVCPDLDTVMYTLAGVSNPVLGWGRRDETWSFMETLGTLGGETWFRLGDRDVARRARAKATSSSWSR